MHEIFNIQRKINELKAIDKRCAVFGAERHQYNFGPILSEEELKKIEEEQGILILGQYRQILKMLGNGGAGAGYGLEKLSLKNINPPYIGHKKLLRNWNNPKEMDCDMVELDEISGYIKLFDYGCGMQTCQIVKGENVGDLIFFDCDGRFEKVEDRNLSDMYNFWLDNSLKVFNRVQQKLQTLSLKEVLNSEWELENYHIKDMIISIMDAEPLQGSYSGSQQNEHLKNAYDKWKSKS